MNHRGVHVTEDSPELHDTVPPHSDGLFERYSCTLLDMLAAAIFLRFGELPASSMLGIQQVINSQQLGAHLFI